ncbi:MAG: hypothetical protein GWN99_11390 [Gemmatimonadetes bacterium]|uniref:Outer membrane lipoprotein-sorting protein n=1 Tax=Candidatus Kutchimonas denitrificans TaxID=3056748 RepID=A0AAE5CA25_9BACT|nr:hypothetical protein [Gemmatimonadota bacterium]NIR74087.1 hypothetical protein [Candidatus Kutchimonas denitrificans]NIS01649.1 hypothetical protein [Gemmatimonadota bacterium]NIT67387.1 hypothetical protein [Gemmatimonadota bacterium]NIU52750.1 hypothetical protein [Gemmatimonadota bacterium]
MIMWFAVLAALAAPTAGSAIAGNQDTLPTLDRLLERYVEAVGGREAISKLKTRVGEGRLVTDLPTWEPPVHESDAFRIYARTPGKYLYVHRTESGTDRDACDGGACWRVVDGELERDAHYDPRFAWFLDPQGALLMKEYFPAMRVTGSATLDGRRVYRVDIDDDESHALYFDAETGLLLRLGYNRTLNDYREVDGVLVPFRLEISRKGGSSTYIFDSIEHNLPLQDSLFNPPRR